MPQGSVSAGRRKCAVRTGRQAVSGSVTRISNALDPTTRTMRVEIDLPNPMKRCCRECTPRSRCGLRPRQPRPTRLLRPEANDDPFCVPPMCRQFTVSPHDPRCSFAGGRPGVHSKPDFEVHKHSIRALRRTETDMEIANTALTRSAALLLGCLLASCADEVLTRRVPVHRLRRQGSPRRRSKSTRRKFDRCTTVACWRLTSDRGSCCDGAQPRYPRSSATCGSLAWGA